MPFAAAAIPIATTVGGMVAGGLQARAANKAAEAQNRRRAVTQRYSPYTGNTPEEYAEGGSVAQGILGGGISGANTGMSVTKGLKNLAPETFGKTAEMIQQEKDNEFRDAILSKIYGLQSAGLPSANDLNLSANFKKPVFSAYNSPYQFRF